MESESSLPYSQVPTTSAYPEPTRFQSPQHSSTSSRSILISSSHLRWGLPNGLFPPSFPTRTLCTSLNITSNIFYKCTATFRTHFIKSRQRTWPSLAVYRICNKLFHQENWALPARRFSNPHLSFCPFLSPPRWLIRSGRLSKRNWRVKKQEDLSLD